MIRTATEIVLLCENRLGYVTDVGHIGLRRARMIEAGKIKRKLTKHPGVTFDDLALAVEYAWRKRIALRSPLGLFRMLEDAAEMANETPQPSVTSTSVQEALDWEMAQFELDSEWIGKLTRAHGPYRVDVLAQWTEAGRGA